MIHVVSLAVPQTNLDPSHYQNPKNVLHLLLSLSDNIREAGPIKMSVGQENIILDQSHHHVIVNLIA